MSKSWLHSLTPREMEIARKVKLDFDSLFSQPMPAFWRELLSEPELKQLRAKLLTEILWLTYYPVNEYCYIAQNITGQLRIVLCPRSPTLDRQVLQQAQHQLQVMRDACGLGFNIDQLNQEFGPKRLPRAEWRWRQAFYRLMDHQLTKDVHGWGMRSGRKQRLTTAYAWVLARFIALQLEGRSRRRSYAQMLEELRRLPADHAAAALREVRITRIRQIVTEQLRHMRHAQRLPIPLTGRQRRIALRRLPELKAILRKRPRNRSAQ